MAPEILAQRVLFIAIFHGIAVIYERDLGIVHEFLVSPTPRQALVLGEALSARVRALSQVVIVYALALVVGVGISLNRAAYKDRKLMTLQRKQTAEKDLTIDDAKNRHRNT